MRLSCELLVMERPPPLQDRRKRGRTSAAKIAVGCQPIANRRRGKQPEQPPLCAIAVYTPQNNNGTIYKVENLCEMVTKLAAKGEVTLRFSEPTHDLCIKSDPQELKTFLQALKALKKGKEGEKPKLSPIKPQSSSDLKRLETKLILVQQADYQFTTDFPSSLGKLQATGCGFAHIDSRILAFKQLQTLVLSHNAIANVDPALGRMSTLGELHMNGNNLKTLPAELFSEGTFPALTHLDLSDNNLTSLPSGLTTLSKLYTLKLDRNRLRQLPNDIGDLSELRFLSLSWNAVQSLPGSFLRMYLEYVELYRNRFQKRIEPAVLEVANPTLQELSARMILKHKLRVQDDIPRRLAEYLKKGTKCSICSSFVLDSFVDATCKFDLYCIAHDVDYPPQSNSGPHVFVPFGFKLCSTKCCEVFRVKFKTH